MGSQLRDALKALGLGLPKKAEPAAKPRVGPEVPAAASSAQPVKPNGVRRLSDPPVARPAAMAPIRLASPAPTAPKELAPARRHPQHGERPPAAASVGKPPAVQPRAAVSAAAPAKPVSRLVRIGDFRPHALFVDDAADLPGLPGLASTGIERQLTTEPEDETDLVLGLDFGTSATKVVIRDAFAATGVFPVQFDPGRSGIDGYLLPSRVFRTGDMYSLHQGTHRITDLKLSLLACRAGSPVTEFNDCCAFLALVIRRARGWLLTEHRDVYSRHALNWRMNLGLPARSYRDAAMVKVFRRLAWAAANLAADADVPTITKEAVDRYRVRSMSVAEGVNAENAEFAWSDVDAVPEVSAQLQGFMSSARWDWQSRPVMMLVDVGAGTVDSALFHVQVPSTGSGVLTFYSSRVEPNGAMNLHRERVRWLCELLPTDAEHKAAVEHLTTIAKPTDRLRPIPEGVRDYLPGYVLEAVGADVDERFGTARYRGQVAGSINDAKVGKGLPTSQLQRVPLLLCGGGSRMRFYGGIGDAINRTQGWNVSVETMRLPVPQDLADLGWHADDFDRLSVAYGLSLAGNAETTLGQIVRDIDVPDVRANGPVAREDNFVSKDQM